MNRKMHDEKKTSGEEVDLLESDYLPEEDDYHDADEVGDIEDHLDDFGMAGDEDEDEAYG